MNLKATGYEWSCPSCDRHGYVSFVEKSVACEECGRTFPAAARHATDDLKNDDQLPVTACAYQFSCPECGTTGYVEQPAAVVSCKKCRMQAAVNKVEHNKRKAQKPAPACTAEREPDGWEDDPLGLDFFDMPEETEPPAPDGQETSQVPATTPKRSEKETRVRNKEKKKERADQLTLFPV